MDFLLNFRKILQSKLDKKVRILEDNTKIAKLKDKKLYEEWEEQNTLSKLILARNLDSYIKVIQYVNFLDTLEGFISSFNFSFFNKDTINIEYNINIEDIIPEQYPTVTKTGKLSIENYTKTAYYELIKLYVCGFAIRMARNIFGLLPIQTAIIHTQTDSLNTQICKIHNSLLISVSL